MININEYVTEKLHLNKGIKTYNDDLESLMLHFDLFDVYDKRYGNDEMQKLSDEEKAEIKDMLLDFITRNECRKENAKYYTNRGRKFDNPKIAKDYKKDNASWMNIDMKIYNEKPIFKHGSLYFKVSDEHKIIEMCGPYGGVKICRYE